MDQLRGRMIVGTKDLDERVMEMTENAEAASRQVATWSEGKLIGARATMSSRSLASYYESPETLRKRGYED